MTAAGLPLRYRQRRLFARVDRLAMSPVRFAARSSRSMLADEAERVIDAVLAGPMPEAVARSLVEHHVIERVVSEVLETASSDGADADQVERLIAQVLRSPALEQWVVSGDAGTLVGPVADHVVQSPALRQTLMEILAS